MTLILVLLCVTIAGLELFLGLSRRRPKTDAGRISELEAARAGLESRLASGETRANAADAARRLLEERLDELDARIAHEVTPVLGRIDLRVQGQLEAERLASLGGPPADTGTLAGAVSGDLSPVTEVPARYAELLDRCGIRTKLEVAEADGTRYYLTCPPDRGPVELEWDFINLLDGVLGHTFPGATARPPMEHAALESLLLAVGGLGKGFVQIGPLVVVRTPDSMLAGVLNVAESRAFDTAAMLCDLPSAAAALHSLPPSRVHDLTHWRADDPS